MRLRAGGAGQPRPRAAPLEGVKMWGRTLPKTACPAYAFLEVFPGGCYWPGRLILAVASSR